MFEAIFRPLSPRRVARVYDRLGTEFMSEMRCNPDLAGAFRALHESGGHAFLDVGVGGGRHVWHYSPENKYVAIDLSEVAIRESEWQLEQVKQHLVRRHQVERHPDVRFVRTDAQSWREEPNSLDGALFAYSLSTMQDPAQAVANGAAAVRSGGRVVIQDYLNGEKGFWSGVRRVIEAYDPSRTLGELTATSPGLRLVREETVQRPYGALAGIARFVLEKEDI